MRQIKKNKIQCLECKGIAESKGPDDIQYCKCGKVFAAGGYDFLQRGGQAGKAYKELSVCVDTEKC